MCVLQSFEGTAKFGNLAFQVRRFKTSIEGKSGASKALVISEQVLSMVSDINTCAVDNLHTISREVRCKKLNDLLHEGCELTASYVEALLKREVEEQQPFNKAKIDHIMECLSPWPTGFDGGLLFDPVLPRLSALYSVDTDVREMMSVTLLAESVLLPLVRQGKEGSEMTKEACETFISLYDECPTTKDPSPALVDAKQAMKAIVAVLEPQPASTEHTKAITDMLNYRGDAEDLSIGLCVV